MNTAVVELGNFEQALAVAKTPKETLKLEAFAKAAQNIARELGLYEQGMNAWLGESLARLKTTELLLPYAPEHGKNQHTGGFNSTVESTNYASFGRVKAELDPNAEIQMTYMEWARRTCEYNLGEERIREEWDSWVSSGVWASRPILWKIAQNGDRERVREELARRGESIPLSDRWHVAHGDIRTWQTDRQYDFIITDPPYPKKYLPLYDVLAERAVEWLKPGGLLIAMSAHYYLNELYVRMDKYLHYFWTASYLVLGESSGVVQKHVTSMWKPLLMYERKDAPFKGKGFSDVFRSDAKDKDNHDWGQSVSGMYDVVSKMCNSGQSILDPFCGAGSTGVAALKHGCFFDGLDIDEQSVNVSKAILYEQFA